MARVLVITFDNGVQWLVDIPSNATLEELKAQSWDEVRGVVDGDESKVKSPPLPLSASWPEVEAKIEER